MADILVSAMGQITSVATTFTYGIDNAGGYGKLAVNAADGIPILDSVGHLIPIADGTKSLGTSSLRWTGVNLSLNGEVTWGDNILGYTNATGPYFFDGTTTLALRFNVQSLTADRVVTWPDAAGTVTLQGDLLINKTALSIAAGVVNINCALGDYFTLALSANVTSLTFSNLPAAGKARTIMVEITQDASAAKTFAFPASFKWPGGTLGVISTALSAVDVLAITTFNNGTAWRANLGNNYS